MHSPRNILVLPGSASPLAPAVTSAYETIVNEAARRAVKLRLLVYPGQRLGEGGRLSYRTALKAAQEACEAERPDWIVGISLGTIVALGLACESPRLMRNCSGMVLWGYYGSETLQSRWGNESLQRASARLHALKLRTQFASDYFAVHPHPEGMIPKAACSMRLARGSVDELNSLAELERLAAMHTAAQPDTRCEVIEVPNAGHLPCSPGCAPNLSRDCLMALFQPFARPLKPS